MPNTELPNLSTWHRVPVGATIPAGAPYAYVCDGVAHIALDGSCEDIVARPGEAGIRYTELPLSPPLPTEEGATIMVPPRTLLTRQGGRWVYRYGTEYPVNEITSWAPVTIGEMVVIR